jgi:hypothetical protein
MPKTLVEATQIDKGTTRQRWVFAIIGTDKSHVGLMYTQAFKVLTTEYNMAISEARLVLANAKRETHEHD